MKSGRKFLSLYPQFHQILKELYLERKLDDWYKQKCDLPFEMWDELESIGHMISYENCGPSTRIRFSLEKLDHYKKVFSLDTEIEVEISKMIPVYRYIFFFNVDHKVLDMKFELWGNPRMPSLCTIEEKMNQIFDLRSYVRLENTYNAKDMIFLWEETDMIEKQMITLEDAIFNGAAILNKL